MRYALSVLLLLGFHVASAKTIHCTDAKDKNTVRITDPGLSTQEVEVNHPIEPRKVDGQMVEFNGQLFGRGLETVGYFEMGQKTTFMGEVTSSATETLRAATYGLTLTLSGEFNDEGQEAGTLNLRGGDPEGEIFEEEVKQKVLCTTSKEDSRELP